MTMVEIDLGTTNSLVTVWRNGKSELIPNATGGYLTPSVVSIDEDGSILVGQAAKERLVSHPDQTAACFKRHMGTSKYFALVSMRLSLKICLPLFCAGFGRMLNAI